MLKELLRPEIEELINNRRWRDIRKGMEGWPPAEIAELILDIEKQDRVLLFRSLSRDVAAEVFSHLEHEQREALLLDLTDQETRQLLADLSPDDRTALLEELPAKATKTLLNLLNPEDLREARELLGYPEDSIGRFMTPDFVAVRAEWSVGRALEHIRQFGKDSETINRIYVTDASGQLIDDILLRNIILAKEDDSISKLMDYNVVSVSAFDDQEEAVRAMEKYDIAAIPVVDSTGKLVGIVTFDDVFDISEEEATEDFQMISAINPVDQSYLNASVWKLWLKRFPWLMALLLVNFLSAEVILKYENVVALVPALSAFIPLLIGTAGNSGTQSSTLIIRSLAINEIEMRDWWKVLFKELSVGILLGAILSLIAMSRGFFGDPTAVAHGAAQVANTPAADMMSIVLVVCISLIVLILWANLIGGLLPILIAKLKLDPAVISSPLIATLLDISGIFVYFNIAIWLLDLTI